LAVLALLGVTLGAVGPWRSSITQRVKSAAHSVRQAIKPQYDPARPTKAEATSSLDDHPATLAIDGVSNSFWAEGADGDGEGQALVLTFGSPVDLDRVGITAGASEKPEDFVAQPRPKQLHLVFSDGSSADLNLKDSADFQTFSVKARDVTSVQMQIVSVYASLSGHDCAIAEVELFTKA
jgi:hypothetical protein